MIGGAALRYLSLSAFPGFKINFRDVGDTMDLTVWTQEDKDPGSATSQIVADANGFAYWYGDNTYRMEIVKSDDTPLIVIPEIEITKKHGSQFGEDIGFGTTLPSSPDDNNLFHMFLLIDTLGAGYNNITGMYIAEGDPVEYKLVFGKDATTGAYMFEDIMVKDAWCDIRWFGCTTASSDCSSEMNSAMTYCKDNGKNLFIPAGTWKFKNITMYDSVKVAGVGAASIVQLPAGASASDTIFTGTNVEGFVFENLVFDGANLGSTYLIKMTKSAESYDDLRIDSCKFQNHQGTAIHITGTSSYTFRPITIIDCQFEGLDKAIYMQYASPIINHCTFHEVNKTTAGQPIFLEDCTYSFIGCGCQFNKWGTTVAAVLLTDCLDCKVTDNFFLDSGEDEDYTIETDGTSDRNMITHNHVHGTHANDITFSGTNNIVYANLGSSAFQNQGVIDGIADVTAWNYELFTADETETTAEGTSNGQLIDTSEVFDGITSYDNPVAAGANYDVVNFPYYTGYTNIWFAINSFVDDNTLQLGNSEVVDSAVTIPEAEPYRIRPNIFDADFPWEDDPYVSTTQTATATPGDDDFPILLDPTMNMALVEIRTNGGSASTPANIYINYGDVTGDLPIASVVDTQPADNHICYVLLDRKAGTNNVNIKMARASGSGTCNIKIIITRMKRAVDQ